MPHTLATYAIAERRRKQLAVFQEENQSTRRYLAMTMRHLGEYEKHFPSKKDVTDAMADVVKAYHAGASTKAVDAVLNPFLSYLGSVPENRRTSTEDYALEFGILLKTRLLHQGVESPLSRNAITVAMFLAAITAGCGFLFNMLRQTTGYYSISGGDNAMVLVAFLLIVLLYFYETRPREKAHQILSRKKRNRS